MQHQAFHQFSQLHHQTQPLLLGNAWNVPSAKLLEKNGYQAIGTSSHALAASLGYEDGENIPFGELRFMVQRIIGAINLPLTVDMEAGFGADIDGLLQRINQLVELGVAGINIEDSNSAGNNELFSVEEFSEKIRTIRRAFHDQGNPIFINARTDAFIRNQPNALQLTIDRAKAYEAAGADGLFVPYLNDANDIRQIVGATRLPLNVMIRSGLPGRAALASLGVKRISMANRFYGKVYEHAGRLLQDLQTDDTFTPLL